MVPIVYGGNFSTYTRLVLVTAHHFGLEDGRDYHYENIPVKTTRDKGFEEKHPFRQLPYLEDGELILYESRAIARYLLAKQGIWPTELVKMALWDQAASVHASNFDSASFAICFERVVKKLRGLGPPDEAAIANHTEFLNRKLNGYERLLGRSKWLTGEEISPADLWHLPNGQALIDLNALPALTNGSLPNVARWWAELVALPAWSKVLQQVTESKL